MMQQDPPEKIKKLLALHLAFFGGALLLGVISFILIGLKIIKPLIPVYHGEIVLLAALISLLSFLISWLIYNRKLRLIRKSDRELNGKLDMLLNTEMSRWVVLGAGHLFCIAAFWLTGEINIFILIVGLLIVLYLTRPTAINIASDLKVREFEIMNLK